MGLAENIKNFRIKAGLSQQEIADALGYKSRSTIAKIESGENAMSKTKLNKLAQILMTTPDILTGNDVLASFEPHSLSNDNYSHKTAVIILAGGTSSRNFQNIPNQFLSLLGKPVIMYCVEAYQNHPSIDDIYIVSLKGWEKIIKSYAKKYNITKLKGIIPAGSTGIQSIRNGIEYISDKYNSDDIIVLQEATRPLLTEEMISKLLKSCHEKGSAVTGEPMNDFVQFELLEPSSKAGQDYRLLPRNGIIAAQSPEAHLLSKIIETFDKADRTERENDETCLALLMHNLGFDLCFYESNHSNLKIVRQEDLAIVSSLLKRIP